MRVALGLVGDFGVGLWAFAGENRCRRWKEGPGEQGSSVGLFGLGARVGVCFGGGAPRTFLGPPHPPFADLSPVLSKLASRFVPSFCSARGDGLRRKSVVHFDYSSSQVACFQYALAAAPPPPRQSSSKITTSLYKCSTQSARW